MQQGEKVVWQTPDGAYRVVRVVTGEPMRYMITHRLEMDRGPTAGYKEVDLNDNNDAYYALVVLVPAIGEFAAKVEKTVSGLLNTAEMVNIVSSW